MRNSLACLLLCFGLLVLPAQAQPLFDRDVQKFVYFSVLEGLYDLNLPAATVDKVLAADSAGSPLSFIPGCPLCQSVQDALRVYRDRPSFTALPAVRDFSQGAATPQAEVAELDSPDPMQRTSALGKLVRHWITTRVAKTNWTAIEKSDWSQRLGAASQEGRRRLALQQKTGETYKMMWSCLMCDGAVRGSRDGGLP